MCTANLGGSIAKATLSTVPSTKFLSPSSALIRRNRVNYLARCTSRLDGEFPCKFIGTGAFRSKISRVAVAQSDPLPPPLFPSSLPLLLFLPALSPQEPPPFRNFTKLSVRSSQLLCWELAGQHPISNKACHRVVVSLRLYPCFPS